jgi:hypothetical protein
VWLGSRYAHVYPPPITSSLRSKYSFLRCFSQTTSIPSLSPKLETKFIIIKTKQKGMNVNDCEMMIAYFSYLG